MIHDSITEDIRAIRRKLAAEFGNDVSRILADVRKKQSESGRVYVKLPKRQPRPLSVTGQGDANRPNASLNGGSSPSVT